VHHRVIPPLSGKLCLACTDCRSIGVSHAPRIATRSRTSIMFGGSIHSGSLSMAAF